MSMSMSPNAGSEWFPSACEYAGFRNSLRMRIRNAFRIDSVRAPNRFGGRSEMDWLSQRAPNCSQSQRVGNIQERASNVMSTS